MSVVGEIWVGGIITTFSIFLLVISSSFDVQKLGFWGVELNLRKQINWGGLRWALFPGLALLFIGLSVTGHGTYRKLFPPVWPTKLDSVEAASLQLSDIDDVMIVHVNGSEVAQGQFGEVPSWVSFKDKLKRGPNSFKVSIRNGQHGGCGGTLTLRLNGLLNTDYRWIWFEQENQMPYIVCYQRVKTLNLE